MSKRASAMGLGVAEASVADDSRLSSSNSGEISSMNPESQSGQVNAGKTGRISPEMEMSRGR